MSGARCLIPSSEFVYAGIKDNITVDNSKELTLKTVASEGSSSSESKFYCVDGNLKGLSAKAGVFRAPRDGLYNISFLCTYKLEVNAKDKPTGHTNTKIITIKPDTAGAELNPIGTTNPFSRFRGKSLSTCSISTILPLVKGEELILSLYQSNSLKKQTTIEAQLVIMYNSSFDAAISIGDGNGVYDNILDRCPGFKAPEGKLVLYVDDRNFSNYANAGDNIIKPFDKIVITNIFDDEITIYPNYFKEIEVRLVLDVEVGIETNNKDMMEGIDIIGFNKNPRNNTYIPIYGYKSIDISYDNGTLSYEMEDVSTESLDKNQKEEILEREFRIILDAIGDLNEAVDLKIINNGPINLKLNDPEGKIQYLFNKNLYKAFNRKQRQKMLEEAVRNDNKELIDLFITIEAEVNDDIIDLAIDLDNEDLYNYLYNKLSYYKKVGRLYRKARQGQGLKKFVQAGSEATDIYGGQGPELSGPQGWGDVFIP